MVSYMNQTRTNAGNTAGLCILINNRGEVGNEYSILMSIQVESDAKYENLLVDSPNDTANTDIQQTPNTGNTAAAACN